MGLDMYAWKVPASVVPPAMMTDVALTKDMGVTELCYWRKHHDLHGFMHRLYEEKGGLSPQFNCNTVRLVEADLDRLENTIRQRMLPETVGFFFGDNPPNDDSDKYDLEFIQSARDAIRNGYAVFYDSWW